MAYTEGCLISVKLKNGKVVTGIIETILIGLDSSDNKSVSLVIDTGHSVKPAHIWLDSITSFL